MKAPSSELIARAAAETADYITYLGKRNIPLEVHYNRLVADLLYEPFESEREADDDDPNYIWVNSFPLASYRQLFDEYIEPLSQNEAEDRVIWNIVEAVAELAEAIVADRTNRNAFAWWLK